MADTDAAALTPAQEAKLEREAQAARIRAEEVARWREQHDTAAAEEADALAALADAEADAERHAWRAARPSEHWPLADVEALAARQDAYGLRARVNAAQEARRAAEWELERLGEWIDPEEAEPCEA